MYALLQAGLSLAGGLADARAVYGEHFNPLLPLKALTYFEDGDLPQLPEAVKRFLSAAAAGPLDTPEADSSETPSPN